MIGRILSHYRIVGQLGAGGMGVVYSAEDDASRSPGRTQVRLATIFAHDEQAILRLRSEARATSALNHPHICTIYDIGEDEGRPFIVMELMKGQSLSERLSGVPLKTAQVVDHRRRDCRRAARGAQRRHRSSRHQAGQHLSHRARPRQNPRLRSGEAEPGPVTRDHDAIHRRTRARPA